MSLNKFLSMLGLGRKAGAVIIGTPLVTKALPSGKVRIVFYPSNASKNTEKKITDKCKFYNVECVKIDTSSEEIAHFLGKDMAVCAVGITDDNFSKQLKTLSLDDTSYEKR